jgi:uncharacterized protein involved in type VI secretion and phage assembly
MTEGPKYFGLFRATVINNVDPMQCGRIQVLVPDVSGLTPSTWAMPCVPVAGIQNGIYAVPVIGSGVWVQFEAGDPDYPVWIGGWWGSGAETPALALAPPPIPPGQNIVVQTAGQNTVVVSDAAPTPVTGGIVLKSTTGAMLVVNDSGIYISNGKGATITMVGPTVTINNGALVVI